MTPATTITSAPLHYRIFDTPGVNAGSVHVQVFEVVKETERGYWLKYKGSYVPEYLSSTEKRARWYIRFVLKDGRKRYCYPSLAEALNSYRIRKSWQVKYLSQTIERANAALERFDKYKDKTVEELQNGVLLSDDEGGFLFGGAS